MTEQERIDMIKNAARGSKGFKPSSDVMEFVSEMQAETFVLNHGLKDAEKEDISDETQFLLTDVAESVDEEDKEIGLSDEMKGVYS
jgi:hypothetical protein